LRAPPVVLGAAAMRLFRSLICALSLVGFASCAPAPAQTAGATQATEPFVIAANPLAADAGLKVLERGGSAVDAAVAVQAMLSLVEPQSSGVGGGAFMTFFDGRTGKITVYDGREVAPAQASSTMFLDQSGQPRVRWWPVAFALQRLEDKRALPALLTLAKEANPYTRAFAVKGLATLRDPAALPVLMPLLSSGERSVLIETIRALGRIGDPAAVAPAP